MDSKKFLSTALAVSLLSVAIPTADCFVLAADDVPSYTEAENDTFKYRVYSDHIELTNIKNVYSGVVIPVEIDGLPVTDWNREASYNSYYVYSVTADPENPYFTMMNDGLVCTTSMVYIDYQGEYQNDTDTYTVPDGIKVIGSMAFNNCLWLKHVNIPDSVEYYGFGAFQGSMLEDIKLSKYVKVIESAAFNTSKLKSVEIDPDNPYYEVVDGSLYDESKENLLTVPREYPESTFTVLEGVRNIDKNALLNCKNIKEVCLPASFDGDLDFSKLQRTFESFHVSENNQTYCDIDGVIFTKDKTRLMHYPNGLNINGEYTVPEGTETIAPHAFYYCRLDDIIFPVSLQELEKYSIHTSYYFDGTLTFLNPKTILDKVYTYFRPNNGGGLLYPDVTVKGYEGSTAQAFARRNNTNFELLDGEPPVVTTTPPTTTATETTSTKTNTKTTTASITATTASVTQTTAIIPVITEPLKDLVKGDVNGDGKVNTADLVIMSQWLLGADEKLSEPLNGDMDGDNRIDVFDLCLLRKEIIKKG